MSTTPGDSRGREPLGGGSPSDVDGRGIEPLGGGRPSAPWPIPISIGGRVRRRVTPAAEVLRVSSGRAPALPGLAGPRLGSHGSRRGGSLWAPPSPLSSPTLSLVDALGVAEGKAGA